MDAQLLLPSSQAALSLPEVRAFCRIEDSVDDALLAAVVRAATDLCEAHTGLTLMDSRWVQTFAPPGPHGVMLARAPVRAVLTVSRIDASGTATALTSADYAVQYSDDRDARLLLFAVLDASERLGVEYRAGLASDPNQLPEGLRHALLRAVAHLYAQRDSGRLPDVPAAVFALWRPYRRVRLI
jgi:uncharacterized phiE125 gp8 family phage protein